MSNLVARLAPAAVQYAWAARDPDLRPVDRRRADAQLDAYSEAAAVALGLAAPFAFKLAALDAVRLSPYPPASPDNAARKVWAAAAVASLVADVEAYL